MSALVTNNGVGYLLTGISETDENVLLKSGQGNRFPQPTPEQDWFFVTVEDRDGNREVMRCVKRDSDTLVVKRGQDDTQARSFKADSLVELRPCAGLFNSKVDQDKFEATIKRLQEQLVEMERSLSTKINGVQTSSSAAVEALKKDTADTYLPLAGGTLTGPLKSNSAISTTATLSAVSIAAKSFTVTPESKE